MKSLSILLLSVSSAVAFTPMHQTSYDRGNSVVQNTIRSQWRMMPEEPAPEVSDRSDTQFHVAWHVLAIWYLRLFYGQCVFTRPFFRLLAGNDIWIVYYFYTFLTRNFWLCHYFLYIYIRWTPAVRTPMISHLPTL